MNKRLMFVFLGGLLSGANAYSQELSKKAIAENVYAGSAKTYTLRNQQKVQQAYQSLTDVYTLDFSSAVAKSVSSKMTEAADKVLNKANYVNYSNRSTIARRSTSCLQKNRKR
jgi:hypothetical protein